MRAIYWRPKGISRSVLLVVTFIALAGFVSVERFQRRREQRYYREKRAAAALAYRAMQVVRAERISRGPAIDREADPSGSGLIGALMTPVTSNTGSLAAKQTSVNPNFAALTVELLKRAGAERGSVVAVGFSGSFPALNICVAAAVQRLGLRAVVVSSSAASQWGANLPDFLWVDMERELRDHHVLRIRSAAASIGGIEDRGLGMSAEGRAMLTAAIARNGVPLLDATSFTDGVEQRMAIYRREARGAPIRAYVNVGGGTTSVGTRVGKRFIEPGLNTSLAPGMAGFDSVMTRFLRQGIPVIHLERVVELAHRYGLPEQPVTIPAVGEGKIFVREEYNDWLAAGVLVAIIVTLYAFGRTDLGFRIVRRVAKRETGRPEPMV